MSDLTQTVHPTSSHEARQAILDCKYVRPEGNRSKPQPRLIEGTTTVSMSQYAGMLEYEPSEFTFTAKSGTTLRETVEVLREKGQYLPFDPMLINDSATLGGTIATGLSGPARFRFGGLRDFLVGASILISNGDLVTTGGKVVKNAAGFDVPKLLIGSLGSLGLIVDVTFKVFPEPPARCTITVPCEGIDAAVAVMSELASSNMELECIDFDADSKVIWVQIAGMHSSNQITAQAIQQQYGGATMVDETEAADYWNSIQNLSWRDDAFVAKCPTSLGKLKTFLELLDGDGFSVRCSAAGQLAWVSANHEDHWQRLHDHLRSLGWSGLVIKSKDRAERESMILGHSDSTAIASSIKQAMDPAMRFPTLN